jgi:hypothetical protein
LTAIRVGTLLHLVVAVIHVWLEHASDSEEKLATPSAWEDMLMTE